MVFILILITGVEPSTLFIHTKVHALLGVVLNVYMEKFMPWIEHVSLNAIETGWHTEPNNCILIQIVDPDIEFPIPRYLSRFIEVHTFKFLDLEYKDPFPDDVKISHIQAIEIAKILNHAYYYDYNIIVHCVAGICRSGAVAEAAESIGFTIKNSGKSLRLPNLLVKHKIMKELRTTYG